VFQEGALKLNIVIVMAKPKVFGAGRPVKSTIPVREWRKIKFLVSEESKLTAYGKDGEKIVTCNYMEETGSRLIRLFEKKACFKFKGGYVKSK